MTSLALLFLSFLISTAIVVGLLLALQALIAALMMFWQRTKPRLKPLKTVKAPVPLWRRDWQQ